MIMNCKSIASAVDRSADWFIFSPERLLWFTLNMWRIYGIHSFIFTYWVIALEVYCFCFMFLAHQAPYEGDKKVYLEVFPLVLSLLETHDHYDHLLKPVALLKTPNLNNNFISHNHFIICVLFNPLDIQDALPLKWLPVIFSLLIMHFLCADAAV